MSERGQPRLWITFDDARLLYAGLSEDKYHAWCFGKTGGVLMNSLVRAGLGFCLRWIWESYRLRVKSGWRCSAGVWVRCFAVAGWWGRGPGRLFNNRPCSRMALCQSGVMCRWFAGVSFPWMRRLTIVYLHRGVPSAVSLGCLGALSVPEPPPKRQVICECDRFFRWSCILNRTDVLLIHGWRGRSRPSG